ncbi:MAG TPA: hypothetical protein PLS46_17100 [Microthrixaceae bacterium]|nr:hypothetical protein [Microthrixaceae bacterium]
MPSDLSDTDHSGAGSSTAPRLPPIGVRYRCSACGNLTRFDVKVTRTTRSFHHYSVGGELEVEDVEVLAEDIEDVSCRWCGTSANVVELGAVAGSDAAS